MMYTMKSYLLILINKQPAKAPGSRPLSSLKQRHLNSRLFYPQRYAYTQTADSLPADHSVLRHSSFTKASRRLVSGDGSRSCFHRYGYSASFIPENADPAAHRNTACPHPADVTPMPKSISPYTDASRQYDRMPRMFLLCIVYKWKNRRQPDDSWNPLLLKNPQALRSASG